MELLKRLATVLRRAWRSVLGAFRTRGDNVPRGGGVRKGGVVPTTPGKAMLARAVKAAAAVALVGLLYAGVFQWLGNAVGRPLGDASLPLPFVTGSDAGGGAGLAGASGEDAGAGSGAASAAGSGAGIGHESSVETGPRTDSVPETDSAPAAGIGSSTGQVPGHAGEGDAETGIADGAGFGGEAPSAARREPVAVRPGDGTGATAAVVSEEPRPANYAELLEQIALPVTGAVGQSSGWRRHAVHGYWYYEPGVELTADEPTVYAVLPGRVTRTARAEGGGFAVVIDHGDGLVTAYEPLTEVYVTTGQYVSARAPIGRTDDTIVFAAFQDDEALDVGALLNDR